MTQNAVITGWGKCLPPAILTNEHLASFLDTSGDWITSRTGIEERRITHKNISDLSAVAGKHALAAAGLEASELDAIYVATSSGDTLIPNTAARVQNKLGIRGCAAVDVNAACSGFIYALTQVAAQIKAGMMEKALVIGADRLTYYVDWTKRNVAILFGDGAGAVVVEATDDNAGFQFSHLGCDSDGLGILGVDKMGTNVPRYHDHPGAFEVPFEVQEIYMNAIAEMKRSSLEVMKKSGWHKDDIDLFIAHQANIRIVDALTKHLKLSADKVFINIEKYGNMSAATVPVALCEAVEAGRVNAGDNIILTAFGAGLTYGACSLKWGSRTTPVAISSAELAPGPTDALSLLKEDIKRSYQERHQPIPDALK